MKLDITSCPFGLLFAEKTGVWLVGGAVRDLLFNREPKDWDLVVDLNIEAIKELTGGKVVGPKGRQVCVFSRCGRVFQVAPLTGGSLAEDLARRDFTVNAMASDPDGEISDPFGGLEDLRDGRLCFVPEVEARLEEDPLRAIRLCRFSASLGLVPSKSDFIRTGTFVRDHGDLFAGLSPHRVGGEIMKGLAFPVVFMKEMDGLGLRDLYFPPMNWGELFEIYGTLPPPWSLSLAFGVMEFLSPGFDWSKTLLGWGVPSVIRKASYATGSLLSFFTQTMTPLEAGRIILGSDPSVLSSVCSLVMSGGIGGRNGEEGLRTLLSVRETIDLALEKGLPLSGGLIAGIIGQGQFVREGLDFVLEQVLSGLTLSIEEIKALLESHISNLRSK